MHEFDYHKKGVFVTLTYSNEYLPPHYSLRKKDLQLFFKRLRKHFTLSKIKYYASGEYGEETHRPHYHAVIFGISPIEYRKIQEDRQVWHHGHVDIGYSVDQKSASYTAKYAAKRLGNQQDWHPRQKPFQLCSQGIGKQYALDNAEELKKNCIYNKVGIRLLFLVTIVKYLTYVKMIIWKSLKIIKIF